MGGCAISDCKNRAEKGGIIRLELFPKINWWLKRSFAIVAQKPASEILGRSQNLALSPQQIMDMELVGKGIVCSTCLSIGRRLYPLREYSDVFYKVIGPHSLETYIEICWECRASLQKMLLFQIKAQKASESLSQNLIDPTELSTLTKTIITDFNETIIEKENSCNVETKTENALIPDDITETIDNDYNISDENHEEVCHELSKVDTKVKVKYKTKSNQRKNRSNRWAKHKALENKKIKYKIVNMADRSKDIYKKIKINETELQEFLAKERRSQFYNDKPYKCEKCVLGFVNKKLLANHKKKRHKKELGPYTCDICQTKLAEKRHLIKHCSSHYFYYKCNVCQYSSYSRDHQMWHYRSSHGKAYQCVKCGLKFGSRKEFFSHYKEWHERFVCDLCGTQFKMRYCIVEHIRKQHSPHRCAPCGKSFARYNGLWLHNKLKHPKHPPEAGYCVECNKHFRNVYAYRWHLSNSVRHTARPRVSVPCPGCDKVFTKKIYMKDHFDLVHMKIYKYRCDLCQKNFLRNADLVKHKKKVHDGIPTPKNKICYMCGRGFSCNKILDNHIRVHTGERPFPCARCTARFAQRAALLSHTKSVHKLQYINTQ